jgi:hypothetical protein
MLNLYVSYIWLHPPWDGDDTATIAQFMRYDETETCTGKQLSTK